MADDVQCRNMDGSMASLSVAIDSCCTLQMDAAKGVPLCARSFSIWRGTHPDTSFELFKLNACRISHSHQLVESWCCKSWRETRLSRLSGGTWKIKKPLERLTKKSTRRPGAQSKWFPCAAMLAEIAQALEGNHVVAANSIGHNRGKKRQGQTADCSTKTKSKQCSTSKKECKNISARGQCVKCATAEATRA